MKGGRFEIAGVDAYISRSGYTGEDGFEISIPADAAEKIADLLCAEPEVKPIGLGARDSLRLEADLPLYGHDLDPETTPIMFSVQRLEMYLRARRMLADTAANLRSEPVSR